MKPVRFRIEGSTVILEDLGISVKRLPVAVGEERCPKVSDEWRQELLAWQAGLCGCCGAEDRKLELDHNHKTGGLRALVCHSCNVSLGYQERNLLVAQEPFKSYLERHAEGIAK